MPADKLNNYQLCSQFRNFWDQNKKAQEQKPVKMHDLIWAEHNSNDTRVQ